MKLRDIIQFLKQNLKRNRVIIINTNDIELQKEFENINIEKIDLSTTLSKLVNGLPENEKKQEGFDILKKFLENYDGDVIALDNIHFVFSHEVGNLDIINILNYFTRGDERVIILFFNGKKRGNRLIYSKEGQMDYKSMDISQNQFVLGWDDEN